MVRSRRWAKCLTIPFLLVTAGCSLGNRPNARWDRSLAPERMMVMAETFERQGRIDQAKNAYLQILAIQPDYPSARENLETLIASELNSHQNRHDLSEIRNQRMIAQSNRGSRKTPPNDLRSPDEPARIARRQNSSNTPVENSAANNVASALPAITEPQESNPLKKTDLVTSNSEPIQLSVEADQQVAQGEQSENLELTDEEPMLAALPQPIVQSPPAPGDVDPFSAVPELSTSVDSTLASGRSDDVPLPDLDGSRPDPIADSPDRELVIDNPWIGDREVSTTEQRPSAEAEADFVQPAIRVDRVTDVEFSKFFGPFHVEMVQFLKEHHEPYMPELLEVVCDPEATGEMRSRAIFLLGAIGPDANRVLPELRQQIREIADPFLKVDLCEAVLKIHAEDEYAIRVLADCLKDSDAEIRWIAVFALRNAVSPRTTFIIESLRETLRTDDQKLKRMVFLTLAEFGPAASSALPEVQAALQSSDPATREVAKAALSSIAPERPSKSASE